MPSSVRIGCPDALWVSVDGNELAKIVPCPIAVATSALSIVPPAAAVEVSGSVNQSAVDAVSIELVRASSNASLFEVHYVTALREDRFRRRP